MRNISMGEMKSVSGGISAFPLLNIKDVMVDPGFSVGKTCWLGNIFSKIKDFILMPKVRPLPAKV
ncbi:MULTISPECIES: hypothetical protein [unclassified Serratia (in: enterobacteria)]|uniref:hypothetical protein n=1 Tax=unclassified Serratia (in: enterobacteria) TaxID=2647522 RepID=UPI002ED34F28|nr:hypothetical protein [Serratia sp. C2(2)]MEE4449349.1 hypothetical protein [Serratia sp. C2(1)]